MNKYVLVTLSSLVSLVMPALYYGLAVISTLIAKLIIKPTNESELIKIGVICAYFSAIAIAAIIDALHKNEGSKGILTAGCVLPGLLLFTSLSYPIIILWWTITFLVAIFGATFAAMVNRLKHNEPLDKNEEGSAVMLAAWPLAIVFIVEGIDLITSLIHLIVETTNNIVWKYFN